MCFAFDNKAQESTNEDYLIEVPKITQDKLPKRIISFQFSNFYKIKFYFEIKCLLVLSLNKKLLCSLDNRIKRSTNGNHIISIGIFKVLDKRDRP